ncbi:hypothetical protein ACFGVR_15705 [Mucilaginibacter sp. AW1-3]
MLTGYDQVVGHTQVPEIEKVAFTGRSITYIDVLATQTRFYELVI